VKPADLATSPRERGRKDVDTMVLILLWLLGVPLGLIVILWLLGIGS
jgi:hypothetical protein